MGVPFFFCLSGFLITYLLILEKNGKGKIFIGKFYLRRILRIWPLYYVVVLFGFLVFPYVRSLLGMESYVETGTFWKYMVFASNFDQLQNGLPIGAGLGVTWSLSVEEQFYLAWPVILALFKTKHYGIVTLIICLSSNIAMYGFGLSYNHTFGAMSDLALGGFVASLAANGVGIHNQAVNLRKWIIALIYPVGIFVVYLMSFGYQLRPLVSLFMVFVIWEQCFAKNSVIKMGRFKRISYWGTLTYGFYLLHTICNFVISNVLLKLQLNMKMPFMSDLVVQPILSLILTFILGYISYRFFEKPFLNLKHKLSVVNTKRD